MTKVMPREVKGRPLVCVEKERERGSSGLGRTEDRPDSSPEPNEGCFFKPYVSSC